MHFSTCCAAPRLNESLIRVMRVRDPDSVDAKAARDRLRPEAYAQHRHAAPKVRREGENQREGRRGARPRPRPDPARALAADRAFLALLEEGEGTWDGPPQAPSVLSNSLVHALPPRRASAPQGSASQRNTRHARRAARGAGAAARPAGGGRTATGKSPAGG